MLSGPNHFHRCLCKRNKHESLFLQSTGDVLLLCIFYYLVHKTFKKVYLVYFFLFLKLDLHSSYLLCLAMHMLFSSCTSSAKSIPSVWGQTSTYGIKTSFLKHNVSSGSDTLQNLCQYVAFPGCSVFFQAFRLVKVFPKILVCIIIPLL